MATEPRKGSSAPLAFVLDVLEYHLRPRLCESGGDLWLDELFTCSVVLGFRAGCLGREGTRAWILNEIRRLVPDSVDGIELRDYTALPGA